MRDKLDNLIGQFGDAVLGFGRVLKQDKNEYIRDSAIQRFEFSFELGWKALKSFLEVEKGIRVYSPRDAIKEAFRVGLIDDDPTWLKMMETRNLTSHVYNEGMAETIYNSLPQYLGLLEKLAKELGAGAPKSGLS